MTTKRPILAALTGVTAFGVAGALSLLGGTAGAQTTPEPEGAGAPAGFGELVSGAAQRGPEFPPECGNFGQWVSATARGVDCAPPPAEEAGS